MKMNRCAQCNGVGGSLSTDLLNLLAGYEIRCEQDGMGDAQLALKLETMKFKTGLIPDRRKAAHPSDAAPPSLDDVLQWLGVESEWWAGDVRVDERTAANRQFQTNLVWQRLTEWRDTRTEPKHGLE